MAILNLILNIGKLVLEIAKCCGVRKGIPVGISFVVVRSMRPLSSVPCPPRYLLLHNPVSFFPTTCRSGDPLWFLPVVAFSAIGLYELSILYLSSPAVPMPITGGSPSARELTSSESPCWPPPSTTLITLVTFWARVSSLLVIPRMIGSSTGGRNC